MLVSHFKTLFKAERTTTSDDCASLTPAQLDRFGFWLDFDPAVEAKYEADTGADRIAQMQWASYSGLVMFNVYNVSDIILHHDILILAWILRLLVVTPSSLVLARLLPALPARWRERVAVIGIINATAIPIFMFYLSTAPLNLYSILEVPLMLVFGGMMLVLRFPHAFVFTVITFLMSILAIMMRSDISPELQFVFILQIFTTCGWILLGNYKIESVRRRTYLQELRERARSKLLEKDRQALKTLSDTDFLTGVGNRRYFDDTFMLKRQDKSALALLMIDVDFFKQFNDTYGHPMGDRCLCIVVDTLKTELRPGSDVLARFGGEEFVVILTNVPKEKALEIADRLRAAVQAAAIPHATRPDGLGVVTISIGGVFIDTGRTETPQQILHLADQALYDAKHLGRNRSVIITGDAHVAGDIKAA